MLKTAIMNQVALLETGDARGAKKKPEKQRWSHPSQGALYFNGSFYLLAPFSSGFLFDCCLHQSPGPS